MNKKKVLSIIKTKEEELRSLKDSVEACNSIDKINSLKVEIENKNEEIRSLKDAFGVVEEKIFTDESWQYNMENSDNENRSEFNPIAAYTMNNNISSNNNIIDKINSIGEISLRSNESFNKGIVIPEEQRSLDIGKYIKGIVTGNWENADSEKRAMTTTATGVMIPTVLATRVLDMSRTQSLFTLANVPIVPMTTNNITVARVKNDPIFKFKEEGKEAIESKFELEPVNLKSKTCYGFAYVTLEAINSSQNLSSILLQVFSKAIAESIDNGMLYGQYNGTGNDAFAPSGLMNDTDINVIQATEGEGYDSFIRAISKIRKNNAIPTSYGINSDTEEKLSLLKDSQGRYLDKPKSLENLKEIVTNQLKNDTTEGNDAIVFDPNAMVIGVQRGISIEMFNNSDECIKKGLVGFKIYSMIDCAVTQPKHICKISGIK